MAIKKRWRRLIFLYIPAIIVVGCGVRFCAKYSRIPSFTTTAGATSDALNIVDVQSGDVPAQSTVENALKIDVGVTKVNEKEVTFHIAMESYQNTEPVQSDILDTTILMADDHPVKPKKWKEINQDDNHKEGYLTFELDQRPAIIKLSIFEMEERVFEWALTSTSNSASR